MSNANTLRELNRLYWESSASVSQIADRLDISRRALYDGIQPQPAGRRCPECGAPLVYRNRTALESREAECPDCGFESPLEASPRPAGAEHPPSGDTFTSTRRFPGLDRTPVLGAAFVAGLALGTAVVGLIRRH
jgi:DNA-directed RNA polymerase subunit RPC12/RpoP